MILDWDNYFMGVALLSSMRSKDPNSQVGACIVNDQNRIVGVGYNGFPKNCSDTDLPWTREGAWLNTKYPYVCHAELNALLNSNGSVNNCRVYVTMFPCNECAKALIQSGIKEVIYVNDKYPTSDSTIASKKLLDMAGVSYREIESTINIYVDVIRGQGVKS